MDHILPQNLCTTGPAPQIALCFVVACAARSRQVSVAVTSTFCEAVATQRVGGPRALESGSPIETSRKKAQAKKGFEAPWQQIWLSFLLFRPLGPPAKKRPRQLQLNEWLAPALGAAGALANFFGESSGDSSKLPSMILGMWSRCFENVFEAMLQQIWLKFSCLPGLEPRP